MGLPYVCAPALGGCGDPGDPIDFGLLVDGGHLDFTPLVAGNRRICAVSLWYKSNAIDLAVRTLFEAHGANNDAGKTKIWHSDALWQMSGFAAQYRYSLFRQRDPASWQHLFVRIDTTRATAADRILVAFNGVQPDPALWDRYNHPSLDFEQAICDAVLHRLGAGARIPSEVWTGYLADFHLLDGVVASPSDFGYFNTDGHWVPRRYTGAHGANGCHLDFADPLDLGKDVSGNANHWTGVNLTPDDQVIDTPTTPRPILNGLRWWNLYNGTLAVLRGYRHSSTNSVLEKGGVFDFPMSSGKWYFTARYSGTPGNHAGIGTIRAENDTKPGDRADTVLFLDAALLRQNGVGVAHGQAWGVGDELMIAIDADAKRIWFGRNGVWFGGGDPAAGLNPSAIGLADEIWLATFVYSNFITELALNCGQEPFPHPPPAGFDPPFDHIRPCPDILDPDEWFTIRRRSAGADVTDLPWDPSANKTLVLSKRLDAAASWRAVDTVGGAGNAWATDDPAQGVVAEADGLTAFTAGGYTIGANAAYQGDRVDYIWRAGARAGFDIVDVAHVNGTPTTVAHAAGGLIDYAWVVRVDAGQARRVFHRALVAGEYLVLDDFAAVATEAGWFSSSPNDVTLGASMPSGTYRLYLWRAVPQFSAFTSWLGNGGVDGPFDARDFVTRMQISKAAGIMDEHRVVDLDQSPVNPIASNLYLDTASVPVPLAASGVEVDLVSNGFKVRTTSGSFNHAGGVVCASWAAAPAKFARAR